MSRYVDIMFEDGVKTKGIVDASGESPTITVGGMPYDLESFAATGAVVAVNDQETMKLLQSAGIKARPTPKQITMTISVTKSFKDRLNAAAKARHTSATGILCEAGEAWLKENNF